MQKSKFRSIIGLLLLYVAILLNWQWIWGILFLIWVIPDLFTGVTYFMEPIEKKSNPIIYWTIIVSWIWMSIYMIATPFLPQLNNQVYGAAQPTQELGIYTDTAIESVKQITINDEKAVDVLNSEEDKQPAKNSTKSKKMVDSLSYKSFMQNQTQSFVGISALMNTNDPDLEKHTSEMWDYFYQNDVSQAITNIVDERIYFIYSEVESDGSYKATLGYRTADTKDIYDGLEGVEIPPSKYAVFEQEGGDSEKFIANTWAKIYESDLNTVKGFNMEVYELNKKYEVQKSEIRIAIK